MKTVVEAWSGRLSCGHNVLCNPGHRTVLPRLGDRPMCNRCDTWRPLVTVRPLRMTRLRRLVTPRRWVFVKRPGPPVSTSRPMA